MTEEDKNRDIEYALGKKAEREVFRDTIRGSLIGGAAGDALGYPVEFMSLAEIESKYGDKGIQKYTLDPVSSKALISDDTQMTLFTATGILVGETRGCLRGIKGDSHEYVWRSYLGWNQTQNNIKNGQKYSWLQDVPELYARRAPGITCQEALSEEYYGTIEDPINDSKGCGGVMRVAPLGLFYDMDPKSLDEEGAAIAALTHGHPLGYITAAMMTHIINQITYHRNDFSGLEDIISDAQRVCEEIFPDNPDREYLDELIYRAIDLAENDDTDEDNIRQLGEGWVAEETLAIAIYCALRHQDDFSAGIIAAVNHDGDSDSTGAVAGNILGAWVGYDAIDEKWKDDLELFDVILEVADDLCQGCIIDEYSSYNDPAWEAKYIHMKFNEESEDEDTGYYYAEPFIDPESGEYCYLYKKHRKDKVWWVDYPDEIGDLAVSFDKKKIIHLFRDYPYAMTIEEKELFDMENPYWADFFRERCED